MAVNESAVPRKKSSKTLIAVLIVIILVLIGGGLAYFQYKFFKVKAEGIAIGYQRAAAAANQMGRPIPDSIFEEGSYRVEVKSNFTGQGQGEMTINVKDLYSNMTHYSLTKPLSSVPGQVNQPR